MCDVCPQSDTARLTEKLRERLQEMTAASQALSSNLGGDEKAAGYLAILDRAICGQLRLVRQLELGQRLYSEDEVRIVKTATDLVELGRDVMQKTDALTRPLLEIEAEFSSSLTTLPAQADRGALEDMLLLFLSNSVRAIGRKGTIRLELERQGDQAVFTMTDTGGGLDPEVLEELFDPDGEEETRTRGLRLAQQIAKLHGGALVISSAAPGGARPADGTRPADGARPANGARLADGARLAVSIPIKERAGGVLRSPSIPVDNSGGWDPALVALSDSLPLEAFLPDGGRK